MVSSANSGMGTTTLMMMEQQQPQQGFVYSPFFINSLGLLSLACLWHYLRYVRNSSCSSSAAENHNNNKKDNKNHSSSADRSWLEASRRLMLSLKQRIVIPSSSQSETWWNHFWHQVSQRTMNKRNDDDCPYVKNDDEEDIETGTVYRPLLKKSAFLKDEDNHNEDNRDDATIADDDDDTGSCGTLLSCDDDMNNSTTAGYVDDSCNSSLRTWPSTAAVATPVCAVQQQNSILQDEIRTCKKEISELMETVACLQKKTKSSKSRAKRKHTGTRKLPSSPQPPTKVIPVSNRAKRLASNSIPRQRKRDNKTKKGVQQKQHHHEKFYIYDDEMDSCAAVYCETFDVDSCAAVYHGLNRNINHDDNVDDDRTYLSRDDDDNSYNKRKKNLDQGSFFNDKQPDLELQQEMIEQLKQDMASATKMMSSNHTIPHPHRYVSTNKEKSLSSAKKQSKTKREKNHSASVNVIDPTTLNCLQRDLKECQSRTIWGISAAPKLDGNKQNMLCWKAMIMGPKATRWENARTELQIDFPKNYPFRPPKIRFMEPTIPLHPNICPKTGTVYMDVLETGYGGTGGCDSNNGGSATCWSPAWCVSSLLISIQSLLDDPSTGGVVVANSNAARLYETNRNEYYRQIQQLVSTRSQNLMTEIRDKDLENMLLLD